LIRVRTWATTVAALSAAGELMLVGMSGVTNCGEPAVSRGSRRTLYPITAAKRMVQLRLASQIGLSKLRHFQ